MSTNTANYGLHQWAGEDKFLRTDFNADMQKIDTGIKAAYDRAGTVEASLTNAISQKADASALAALQTTVNGKADASALTALQTTVNSKANSSTVTALQTTVNGKADTSALAALQTTVNGKAEVVLGTYTGDGSYPRTITLGFQPQAVLLMTMNGYTNLSGSQFGGLMTPTLPMGDSASSPAASVTTTGFQLIRQYTNQSGTVYRYLALK